MDRYFIEQFLAAHRQDIRGRVLEVKDNEYTTRFGTDVWFSSFSFVFGDEVCRDANSRSKIVDLL